MLLQSCQVRRFFLRLTLVVLLLTCNEAANREHLRRYVLLLLLHHVPVKLIVAKLVLNVHLCSVYYIFALIIFKKILHRRHLGNF